MCWKSQKLRSDSGLAVGEAVARDPASEELWIWKPIAEPNAAQCIEQDLSVLAKVHIAFCLSYLCPPIWSQEYVHNTCLRDLIFWDGKHK